MALLEKDESTDSSGGILANKYDVNIKDWSKADSPDESPFDILPCCRPKSGCVDCWTALTSLFRPNHVDVFQDLESNRKSNRSVRLKLHPTVLGASTSTDSDYSIPNCSSMILFTSEENSRLARVFEVLASMERDDENNNGHEEDEEEGSKGASFLFALAKAAAGVALEDAVETIETESAATFQDNDPETAVQKLLEAGKRQESLQLRYKEHMQRIEILVMDYPALLEQPLEACWKNLEHAINRDESSEEARQENFLSTLSMLLGKAGDFATLEFLLSMMESEDNDQIYNLMRLCFHLAFAHAFLSEKDPKQLENLHIAMADVEKEMHSAQKDPALEVLFESFQLFQQSKAKNRNEADKFLHWYCQQIPSLLAPLSLCIQQILFPELGGGRKTPESIWLLPNLDRNLEENLLFSRHSWLFAVACSLPLNHHKKGGSKWHRLLSSDSEGFNLATLEHGLTGYRGSTILLVEAYDRESKTVQIFGAFASQPWTSRTSPDFYGDDNSFLFQLQPHFRVFRAKESGVPNFQYFYFDKRPAPSTISDKTNAKHEHGIGMGGSPKRPRFFVSASLDKCHFGTDDATFETSNDNVSNNLWMLHSLEVWGVGGESALRALTRHRSVEEANLQKARQVDKAAFLGDFRTGLIESKMFGHRQEMQNRDGGCLLDCDDE